MQKTNLEKKFVRGKRRFSQLLVDQGFFLLILLTYMNQLKGSFQQ